MPSHPLTPGTPLSWFPGSILMMEAYAMTGRLSFKDSPFYTILEPLTSTLECKSESCAAVAFMMHLEI